MQSTKTIFVPASKSICNRVLIINKLSNSGYAIEHLSDCDDTLAMLGVLASKGNDFNIGAAGTAMRFLTAFLGQKTGVYTITGSERMQQRPIKILVDALNQIGADIQYLGKEGFPPLKIMGKPLQGGTLQLDGGVSSQYISALMMIAPYTQEGLRIELQGNIVSQSYIKMTQKLMQQFGVLAEIDLPFIDIKPQIYTPIKYTVESDWSGVSYWYEWLSVAGKGELFIPYLYNDSLQGDSKVADIFIPLGVKTQYKADGIVISASGEYCSEFNYDFINQPDLAQSVAVACCLRAIPFRFAGLQTLKIKETDRIAALIAELAKLGFVLCDAGDGVLFWDGTRCPVSENIAIRTYEDHRMAMAFSVAKLQYQLTIEHPEVVSKSYPDFWNEFAKL